MSDFVLYLAFLPSAMSVALGRIEGMDLLATPLRGLQQQARDIVREAESARALQRADDTELVAHLAAIAEVGRLVDALLVDAVGEVMRRSERATRDERLTSRLGCRDVSELVQTLTRVEARTAARWQRAGAAVRPSVSEMTGELLDAAFPAVREAMTDGVLSVDGILAICEPLQATAPRVTASSRREAAAIAVAEARGEGPDGAPPVCAALLRIHAQTWALALDQDGAEPRERVAQRKRSFVIGIATPSGVPVRGILLPDVAAQLQTIFDAQLSPKVVHRPRRGRRLADRAAR